jgi:hypothetical protein
MNNLFERVYCINLDRRQDRWEQFVRTLPADWPFKQPERFAAIDGERCPPPEWWRQGKGAWGCARSHATIIERCLNEGVESVLILEDDVVFDPQFAERARVYIESIPLLDGMVYFGGQHLGQERHPPLRINEHVFLAYNINRAHAYGIIGRRAMKDIYRHICRNDWLPNHHIDHHFGRLQESFEITAYTPTYWMAGQGPGKSNICGRDYDDTRYWRHAAEIEAVHRPPMAPVIGVVGPFRSGTSCVAGVLHTLGVPMAAALPGPVSFNRKGTFEAPLLAKLCRRFFREPDMEEQMPSELRVAFLRRWLIDRTLSARGGPIGAKHPSFCLMLPDLGVSWPHFRAVFVTRNLASAIKSGLSVGWLPTAGTVIPAMLRERDKAASSLHIPIHHVQYEELLDDPARVIDDLVRFCELPVTSEAKRAAIMFVDAGLCHHRESEVAHAC